MDGAPIPPGPSWLVEGEWTRSRQLRAAAARVGRWIYTPILVLIFGLVFGIVALAAAVEMVLRRLGLIRAREVDAADAEYWEAVGDPQKVRTIAEEVHRVVTETALASAPSDRWRASLERERDDWVTVLEPTTHDGHARARLRIYRQDAEDLIAGVGEAGFHLLIGDVMNGQLGSEAEAELAELVAGAVLGRITETRLLVGEKVMRAHVEMIRDGDPVEYEWFKDLGRSRDERTQTIHYAPY